MTYHDEQDGYHDGCLCPGCKPTTLDNYAKENAKKTDHPGWKPEGFMRMPISVDDANALIAQITKAIPGHFEAYGSGIFTHPHEIVGCMTGQLYKLSAAADESIYDGELQKFRTRCVKTLMAIFVGLASVDKLIELRKATNE